MGPPMVPTVDPMPPIVPPIGPPNVPVAVSIWVNAEGEAVPIGENISDMLC